MAIWGLVIYQTITYSCLGLEWLLDGNTCEIEHIICQTLSFSNKLLYQERGRFVTSFYLYS